MIGDVIAVEHSPDDLVWMPTTPFWFGDGSLTAQLDDSYGSRRVNTKLKAARLFPGPLIDSSQLNTSYQR